MLILRKNVVYCLYVSDALHVNIGKYVQLIITLKLEQYLIPIRYQGFRTQLRYKYFVDYSYATMDAIDYS